MNLFKNKIEVIPFRQFVGNESKPKETPLSPTICAHSAFLPAISPQNLFPLHDPVFALFVIGGVAIVALAAFERFSANEEFSPIAESISAFVGFVLPVVGFGLVFWFLFSI